MSNKLTLADDSTVPPLGLTARSTAPSSPVEGSVYLDDGTNTASGKKGLRHYTSSAWTDLANAASALGNVSIDQLILNDGSELTISGGEITVTKARHTVDTQADAASDDLDTISGTVARETFILSADDTARTVVIKNGTGNIITSSGADITLDETYKAVLCESDGTNITAYPLFTVADVVTPNYGTASVKTLASGIITVGDDRNIVVAAETGTTDDLIEITGLTVGDSVMLRADTTDTITVKHNDAGATIKILIQDDADFVLDVQHPLELMLVATNELVQVYDEVGAGAATTAQLMLTAAGGSSPTTNGAADGTIETTTNAVLVPTKDFDASTDEYVQWAVPMPDNWDGGTITATFYWSAASGSGDVVWGLQGVGFANDDALDAAFGTAQTVTDTLITAEDLHITATTSAITIAGSPAAGELVVFRAYRDADNVGDTLAVDAQLIAVNITYGLS